MFSYMISKSQSLMFMYRSSMSTFRSWIAMFWALLSLSGAVKSITGASLPPWRFWVRGYHGISHLAGHWGYKYREQQATPHKRKNGQGHVWEGSGVGFRIKLFVRVSSLQDWFRGFVYVWILALSVLVRVLSLDCLAVLPKTSHQCQENPLHALIISISVSIFSFLISHFPVPTFSTTRYQHLLYNSLVPRPHLQGGKGSGEFGQNPWACAEEFPRANEIAGLLSHMINIPKECNIAV